MDQRLHRQTGPDLSAPDAGPSQPAGLSPAVTALFALACGVTVANLYYSQSLVGLIARDLGIPESLAGSLVTITQVGYGVGLFFLVCLGDLLENKRLILITNSVLILSLLGVVLSPTPPLLFLSFFLVGVTAVGTQILVPLAAHLTPEHKRGVVLGNIMSGLLAGIMLCRPLASFLAAHFGWRSVFIVSIGAMAIILVLLKVVLPTRKPNAGIGYGAILRSILSWLVKSSTLKRRAAYQGTLFAVFNLFWTAAPLMLHDRFGLSQSGIALFALAGAGGALAAPVAGRLGDRGHTRIATGIAMAVTGLSFLLSGWSVATGAMALLVFSAIALDASVQANQIFSQRAVYGLTSEARGRVNSAFMTVAFMCGAVGSTLGSLTYVGGGWWLTAGVGAGLCALILATFATE
ncbi:MFS transporter [Xanthobacter autotrophicus DSM 431]|uniref:MFS transporter n=1 Tax=Xanthobacter nonsaccharivorans TaxID=3119912 RepID=UPI003728E948